MKIQSSLEAGIRADLEGIAGIAFTKSEEDFLAVAEGFLSIEFAKACGVIGLGATIEEIPENFERAFQIQGRWDGDYPTPEDLVTKPPSES